MISASRRSKGSISAWPGYVDVLSALLMVVIFVLLIFIFAHFILNEILSGQESELITLRQRLEEITRALGLEQQRNEELSEKVATITVLMEALSGEKEALEQKIETLTHRSGVDQAQITDQLYTIASLQEDISALRQLRKSLEARVQSLAASLAEKESLVGNLRDRTKALEARLAEEQERTLLAQKRLEKQDIRIQALTAVVGSQKEALEKEKTLSADARAEVALLNRRIARLREQLKEISRALAVAESENTAKEARIKDLGQRLNIALARKVNKLEQYRSEFFGRLKQALGPNPYIRIEGDRFVFQAELLFKSGSAQIDAAGKQHLDKLAQTLKEVAAKIPDDLNWILRIDGHTDRIPIHNELFASNWELSTARAVSVVKFLAQKGIPETRMAATGFSKFHPLDPSNTAEAYRKNRRIEIKLTSR